MKFGKYLHENTLPEWRFYYIDYDGLKRLLKDREIGETFSEQDEATFVETLEKEMQKVGHAAWWGNSFRCLTLEM